MTSTPIQTKVSALVLALLTSVAVLGTTVAGMQPRTDGQPQVIALDSVTVTATKAN